MIETIELPVVTFGNLLDGFEDFFKSNFQLISSLFEEDQEVKQHFNSIEEFGVELYCEIMYPSVNSLEVEVI